MLETPRGRRKTLRAPPQHRHRPGCDQSQASDHLRSTVTDRVLDRIAHNAPRRQPPRHSELLTDVARPPATPEPTSLRDPRSPSGGADFTGLHTLAAWHRGAPIPEPNNECSVCCRYTTLEVLKSACVDPFIRLHSMATRVAWAAKDGRSQTGPENVVTPQHPRGCHAKLPKARTQFLRINRKIPLPSPSAWYCSSS